MALPGQVRHKIAMLKRGEYVLLLVALAVASWLLLPALLVTFIQAIRVPVGNLFFEPTSSWGLSNFPAVYSGSRALQSTLLETAIYTLGAVSLGFTIGLGLAW